MTIRWLVFAFVFLFVSCSDNSSNNTNPIETGRFLDSAVEGLNYTTDSGLSGFTNSEGEFQFRAGDNIEFRAGALTLGTFVAAQLITPFELEQNNELDRERVKNIILLLQSLDIDRDPENGIDIRSAVQADILDSLSTIDITVPSHRLTANAEWQSILASLTGDSAFVPLDGALRHAVETHGFVPVSGTTKVYTDVVLDSRSEAPEIRYSITEVSGAAVGRVTVGAFNGYASGTVDIDGVTYAIPEESNQSARDIAEALREVGGIRDVYVRTFANIEILADYPTQSNPLKLNDRDIFGANDLEIAQSIDSWDGYSAFASSGQITLVSHLGEDLRFDSFETPDGFEMVVRSSGEASMTSNAIASPTTAITIGGMIYIAVEHGILIENGGSNDANSSVFTDRFVYTEVVENSFDPEDSATYNHAITSTIYDSLGNAHELTQYFIKTIDSHIWVMWVQIDGRDVGDPDEYFPDLAPSTLSGEILIFESAGSTETIVVPLLISNWTPVDQNGQYNGAMVGDPSATSLEVPFPPMNSNFVIEVQARQSNDSETTIANYQNGIGNLQE